MLKTIHDLPIVDSVQSVISQGKVKHYKVHLKVEKLDLQEELEKLWGFGVVTLNGGNVFAEYIVQPIELSNFYQKIVDLNSSQYFCLKALK